MNRNPPLTRQQLASTEPTRAANRERLTLNLRAEIQRLLGMEDSVKNDAALVFYGRYLREHLARLAKRMVVLVMVLALVGCAAKVSPPPTRPMGVKPGTVEYNRWQYEVRMAEIANAHAEKEADGAVWIIGLGVLAAVGIALAVSSDETGGEVVHVVCHGCR